MSCDMLCHVIRWNVRFLVVSLDPRDGFALFEGKIVSSIATLHSSRHSSRKLA